MERFQHRLVARQRYQALLLAVGRAIDDADPLGLLKGGAPADEYGPEIGTIVPRVAKAQSVQEVAAILHDEFIRWFGGDIGDPGHAYDTPAATIWEAVLEFRKSV